MPFEEPVETRLEWELPELVAVGLLVVVIVLAVTSVVFAIIDGVGQATPLALGPNFRSYQTLANATGWSPINAFFVVAASGLLWWQVQGWQEVVDDADEDDPDVSPEDSGREVRIALGHLSRAKNLAAGVIVMLIVFAVASLGGIIANFLMYRGLQEVGSTYLADHVQAIGDALATLTLVGVAGLVVRRVRAAVIRDFQGPEVADDIHLGITPV